MRNLRLMLCVVAGVLMASCANKNFTLIGNLPEGFEPTDSVVLCNYDNGDTVYASLVGDLPLALNGEIEVPTFVRMYINGRRMMSFILEPGVITLDFDNKEATGTNFNEVLNNLSVKVDSIQNADELEALLSVTLKENMNNPIGYYAFTQLAYGKTQEQLDSLNENLPKSITESKRAKKYYDSAVKQSETAVGKTYKDFAIKSDTSEVKLSDYLSADKLNIVDFWASWCVYCIKEVPNLKSILEKYGPEKVNIIGVAVWDKLDDSKESIKKHEMTWSQILDAQNVPTDLYGVMGIPHIMIIGADGTIMARGLQGEELLKKVDELIEGNK